MEAVKVLVRLLLHATIVNTIVSYDWLSEHYYLAERYNCANYLDVFFDRAVLFKYGKFFANSWPGNADFDCDTSVYSRTKSSGIISVIQKMKFRSESECVDYIKTSESERLKCGEIIFGMRPTYGGDLPPAGFISRHPGPFVLYRPTYPVEPYNFGLTHSLQRENLVPPGCSVEPTMELRVQTHIDSHAMRQDIEMTMALTSYRECDTHTIPEGWFNCGYGVCISSKFVNDGVVNCPFGDCIDEGGCKNAMETSPFTGAYFNASDTSVKQGFPNRTDSRALEESSELTYCGTAVKDLDILLRHLLKEDLLKNITAELKKHNENMDGILKMMEIKIGLMTERRYEVGYDNSTTGPPPA